MLELKVCIPKHHQSWKWNSTDNRFFKSFKPVVFEFNIQYPQQQCNPYFVAFGHFNLYSSFCLAMQLGCQVKLLHRGLVKRFPYIFLFEARISSQISKFLFVRSIHASFTNCYLNKRVSNFYVYYKLIAFCILQLFTASKTSVQSAKIFLGECCLL